MRIIYRASPFILTGLLVYVTVFHTWGVLYALGVHPYPESSSTPWTYQMWSGIIPALTIASLFGSLGGLYHLHNCHATRCFRLGKHRVNGTPWCTRHMSLATVERSMLDVLESIEAALNRVADDSKLANDAMADVNRRLLAALDKQ